MIYLQELFIEVEKGVYNQVQWFEFSDDRITIRWFKTGPVEKLPSKYIKIISNIDKSLIHNISRRLFL